MHTRRQFLGAIGLPFAGTAWMAGGGPALRGTPALPPPPSGSPAEVARDEDFWFEMAQAFTIDRSVVNLNNGGVSPAPALVQEAHKRHLDYSNQAPPPHALWRVLEPQQEGVRQRLAAEWGVDAEEVALTRNASEGLQICQFGFDLERGDEVLTTNQDYPRMISTFEQRERREGVVLKRISLPTPVDDVATVVRLFEEAITERTKLILMCHMINLTGQILPVKEVVAMARRRGIPVIVDGAHALAHFDFSLADLECDYYASSLHKWLFAPHGTGFLYVRRERIRDLWPLMAAAPKLDDDIRKFEQIGTHPLAQTLAIGEALTFHQGIGGARKEARLTHLRDSWAERLLAHDRVRLHTSLEPGFACGIANVEVEGLDTGRLQSWLWREHRILTTAIVHDEFTGLRISPSVYTMPEELDRFVAGVEHALDHGLPG